MGNHTGAPTPSLERVMQLDVEIGTPIGVGDTGNGHRLIIPITGGTVSGEVSGTVLAAGADYQLFRLDGPTEVDARYVFETEGGSKVYIRNEGIVDAPPDIGEQLLAGEEVDSGSIYFRTVPTFETSDPDLSWLSEHIFVGSVTAQSGGIRVEVYRVD